MADIGVETTQAVMAKLTAKVSRKRLNNSDALYHALIEELQNILKVVERPLQWNTGQKPYVILMVGINGVGKTTTIGKLAKQFQAQGKTSCSPQAPFRAAAVGAALQVWGETATTCPSLLQRTHGADSAGIV